MPTTDTGSAVSLKDLRTMASIAHTHAPLGAVTDLRPVGIISSFFQTIVAWNDNRQTQNELAKLTRAQLEDIGLTDYSFSVK